MKADMILSHGPGELSLLLETNKQGHMLLAAYYSNWRMHCAADYKCEHCMYVRRKWGEATQHLQGKRTVRATQVPLQQCSRINFTPGPQCRYITNIDGTSPLYLAHLALCYYP